MSEFFGKSELTYVPWLMFPGIFIPTTLSSRNVFSKYQLGSGERGRKTQVIPATGRFCF